MTIILEAKNEFDEVIKNNPDFELTDEATKDIIKIIENDPRLSFAVDSSVGCKNQSLKIGVAVGIISGLVGIYIGWAVLGRR